MLYFIIKLLYSVGKSILGPYFKGNLFICKALIGKKRIKLNAFLDTGNLLTDTKSNLPVVICELNSFCCIFNKSDLHKLLSYENIDKLNSFHYITYKTIGGDEKRIAIFKPDCFFINNSKGKEIKCECFIGLSINNIFYKQNYQALIGLDLVGDLS